MPLLLLHRSAEEDRQFAVNERLATELALRQLAADELTLRQLDAAGIGAGIGGDGLDSPDSTGARPYLQLPPCSSAGQRIAYESCTATSDRTMVAAPAGDTAPEMDPARVSQALAR